MVPGAHPPCSCTCPPVMVSTVPVLGTHAGVSWKVLPDPNDHQPPTVPNPAYEWEGDPGRVWCPGKRLCWAVLRGPGARVA